MPSHSKVSQRCTLVNGDGGGCGGLPSTIGASSLSNYSESD